MLNKCFEYDIRMPKMTCYVKCHAQGAENVLSERKNRHVEITKTLCCLVKNRCCKGTFAKKR